MLSLHIALSAVLLLSIIIVNTHVTKADLDLEQYPEERGSSTRCRNTLSAKWCRKLRKKCWKRSVKWRCQTTCKVKSESRKKTISTAFTYKLLTFYA